MKTVEFATEGFDIKAKGRTPFYKNPYGKEREHYGGEDDGLYVEDLEILEVKDEEGFVINFDCLDKATQKKIIEEAEQQLIQI